MKRKEMTISVRRGAGWGMALAILATTIRAYLDGSRHIEFSIHEEVNP